MLIKTSKIFRNSQPDFNGYERVDAASMFADD